MLLNILETQTQKPTSPLEEAAKNLLQAGTTAGEISNDEAHVFQNETPGAPNGFAQLSAALKGRINSVQGGTKGPAVEACNISDEWLKAAIFCRYRISDANVQNALAYYVLAVVTGGFQGQDVGGTTIGNSKADWRGGGFFDFEKKK